MCAQPAKSYLGLKIGIVLAVLIGAGVVLFYRSRATAVVATVHRGPAADLVTGSVVVHADKDLQEIKSEIPGRVVWIDPREVGEQFKAGDPIIKLDSTEIERQKKHQADLYEAAVKRARTQRSTDPRLINAKEVLANAEREYRRGDLAENLWNAAQRVYRQVETDLELLDQDAQVAKMNFENDQALLQRQIEKMTIRAPVDCTLHAVPVAIGALIGPNTTVATYYATGRSVIVKVSEEDVGRVKIGQPAIVRLQNLPGSTFDAEVTTILPFADAETQRYSVYLKVKTDVKNLMPFSQGEASITAGQRENQPLIPRRALFNDDYVFVVRDGVVEKRKVAIGYRALNMAEVLDRLKEGEQVIVEDVDMFRDGQHVRVKQSQ